MTSSAGTGDAWSASQSPPQGDPATGTGPVKISLRRTLLATRRTRTGADRDAAGPVLAERVLALPEVAAARTVAAYAAVGTEPPTAPLLDRLAGAGVSVLLPRLLAGGDLDWAVYTGTGGLAAAARGLHEPTGPSLGPDGVRRADVLVVPGLAVGADGMRLGRGGGSYDRVLARVAAGPPRPLVLCLLWDDELLPTVPAQAHDRPVDGVVTPIRVVRFPADPAR